MEREYHILVVEDDKEIREGVEIYLKNQGYLVFQAANGQEGLDVLKKEEIHLAIVDIMMPVMDGLEATRRIRLKGGTLPIIALTANAYDSDRDKAFEAGCDDYMAKPIMAPALREMIKKYFGE